MAFDISGFKNAMSSGGARANLFQAELIVPGAIGNAPAPAQGAVATAVTAVGAAINSLIGSGGDSARNFSYLCKVAQIPGKTIGTIEVPYMGRKQKVPGDLTFQNLQCTILNDESFTVRRQIEWWMNCIKGHNSNAAITNKLSDLYGQLILRQFSRDQVEIATYTFIDVYPAELGAIDMNWETNDAIEEFTVSFDYTMWESEAAK